MLSSTSKPAERIDALTGLSELAQRVAAASDAHQLAAVVVTGSRELLAAEMCQLFRLEPHGEKLQLLASEPPELAAPSATSAAELMLAALGERDERPTGKTLWPTAEIASLLVTPLVTGGQRVGLLCVASSDGAGIRSRGSGDRTSDRSPDRDRDQTRRADRTADKREHHPRPVRGGGSRRDSVCRHEGGRDPLRPDSSVPDALRGPGRRPRSGLRRVAHRGRGGRTSLGALVSRSAIDAGPGPMRALIGLFDQRGMGAQELLEECRELGSRTGSVIGISQQRDSPGDAADAYREARDAATIGRALLPSGGALAYSRGRRLPILGADPSRRRAARSDAHRCRRVDRIRQPAPDRAARRRSSAISRSVAA